MTIRKIAESRANLNAAYAATARKEQPMASDSETVADIICEMRGSTEQRYCSSKHCRVKVYNPMLDFADRIEAAHNREVAEFERCKKRAAEDICAARKAEAEAKMKQDDAEIALCAYID